MSRAVDVRVTGRVQGVSFRAETRREAERLGVAGWVRNEPDGSVRGHFEGADDRLDALVDWCRTGPSGAQVDDVDVDVADADGLDEFEVRR